MKPLQQFTRFAAIGALATGLQYLILILLVQGQLAGAVIASSIGFTASSFINYLLNRRYTFRSDRSHSHALPRFMTVASIGLGINAVLMWLFSVLLGFHYLVAQLAATGGALVWNYSMNRAWTFSKAMPSNLP
jgi:putative flippase GtrA